MAKIQFKLSLLGDGGVGKTSIKNRYLTGKFTDKYMTTLGVDFSSHTLKIDDKNVYIAIWDVAGQQVFSSIRKSYFEGSRGALVVFDVTRLDSFENLLNDWVKPFFDTVIDKPPMIIIANKVDLKEERLISADMAEKFVADLKTQFNMNEISYLETSAKDGTNVSEAFEKLTRYVISR
jgi:small GTP-binding protein